MAYERVIIWANDELGEDISDIKSSKALNDYLQKLKSKAEESSRAKDSKSQRSFLNNFKRIVDGSPPKNPSIKDTQLDRINDENETYEEQITNRFQRARKIEDIELIDIDEDFESDIVRELKEIRKQAISTSKQVEKQIREATTPDEIDEIEIRKEELGGLFSNLRSRFTKRKNIIERDTEAKEIVERIKKIPEEQRDLEDRVELENRSFLVRSSKIFTSSEKRKILGG